MSEPAMQILLVEDQSDAVDLLQELVRTVFPTAQVKVCGTVAHALMQLDLPWQLALVDLRLLDGSGLVVLQALKAAQPDTQAIVTTLYHDDDIVFSALQAGADGYLLKSDPLPSLVSSLRRMADGEPPLSAAVARRILKHCRSGQVQPVAATPLQAAVLTGYPGTIASTHQQAGRAGRRERRLERSCGPGAGGRRRHCAISP